VHGFKKRLNNWLCSRVTRVLLAVFLLLVFVDVFIGLQSTTGFVIGYLATTVLAVELTRRWRKLKNFIILFLAAFLGSILLAFLHEEVVYPLAGFIGGPPVVNSTPMNLYHDITSGIILFFGPVGMLVGFSGGAVMVVLRLVTLVSRKSAVHDT
jgi:hypothetical protein